jgi:hypothetical protein
MDTKTVAEGTWRYRINCVESTGRAINDMTDAAREISRATFLRYVDRESLVAVEEILGYESHHSRGLTMSQDWHVSYHRSVYRGRPCVYFKHSSIEYIFY